MLDRRKEKPCSDAQKRDCSIVLGSQNLEESVKMSAVCVTQYFMSLGCRHMFIFVFSELKLARI